MGSTRRRRLQDPRGIGKDRAWFIKWESRFARKYLARVGEDLILLSGCHICCIQLTIIDGIDILCGDIDFDCYSNRYDSS